MVQEMLQLDLIFNLNFILCIFIKIKNNNYFKIILK